MRISRAQLKPVYGTSGDRNRLLDKPVTVIGRSSSCDIRLGSVSIKPRHCVIVRDMGDLYLRDLSGEGELLNEERIVEEQLHDGDELAIGKFRFLVELPAASADVIAPPPLEASLFEELASSESQSLPLERSITLVGSDSACDITLDRTDIASQHCLLVRTSGGVYLRDLSGEGTSFVNGEPVEVSLLDRQDEITIGSSSFLVQMSGPVDLPVSEASGVVLVADPDSSNLGLLRGMLSKAGYAVRPATTAESALEWLEDEKIDLALVDAELADVPGLELCHRIKSDSRWSQTSVIFMASDLFTDEGFAAGFEAGACDFVVKPLRRSEVLARVGSRLREKRAQESFVQMSQVDPLTGLMNRRGLEIRLSQTIAAARRRRQPTSMIMVDLDFFKNCNDKYGHDFGDRVLREFASVLQANCREEDLLARYGGEEFCIILPETSFHEAKMLGERLRHCWETTDLDHQDQILRFTASFGVSFRQPSKAIEDRASDRLIKEADMALYAAKARGKNLVVGADAILGDEEKNGQDDSSAGREARTA
jgi:diguanylate cyclase (GGDEF)-like protein